MFRRQFVQLLYLAAAAMLLILPPLTAVAQELPPEPPAGGDFAPRAGTQKLPEGVLLIKGAEPSASDRVTPLPEEGTFAKNVYQNRYFGISYPLPEEWAESFQGPPPSDHGRYVLGNLLPAKSFKRPVKGTIAFTAQDMFFSLAPAKNAAELISARHDQLPSYYETERPPAEVKIAGHPFTRFDYKSPAANIHWVVLATQIRCHELEWVLTSQDPKLNEDVVADMNRMTLPDDADPTSGTGGGETPLCVANYATGDHLIRRVDPEITDRKFNDIPARIIIDKKGHVRHVHVLSAFPKQAQVITDALLQWTFKPYLRNGQPVEVETGVMFGESASKHQPSTAKPAITAAKSND